MLDKERLIKSINERLKCFDEDITEESKLKATELRALLYVINKGCFDKVINKETEIELATFINENSGYWDLNLSDVKEFLSYNKDGIIQILQRL